MITSQTTPIQDFEYLNNLDLDGKNNMLLKNTKAVSIVINGNFYQINVNRIFDIVSEVYSEIF